MINWRRKDDDTTGGETGMADDLRTLALDLKEFLVKFKRATDIEGPDPLDAEWLSWEIRFTHKGQRRHYVYRVQRRDSTGAMLRALRAETNGELLVRIPNDLSTGLHANYIFYPPHG